MLGNLLLLHQSLLLHQKLLQLIFIELIQVFLIKHWHLVLFYICDYIIFADRLKCLSSLFGFLRVSHFWLANTWLAAFWLISNLCAFLLLNEFSITLGGLSSLRSDLFFAGGRLFYSCKRSISILVLLLKQNFLQNLWIHILCTGWQLKLYLIETFIKLEHLNSLWLIFCTLAPLIICFFLVLLLWRASFLFLLNLFQWCGWLQTLALCFLLMCFYLRSLCRFFLLLAAVLLFLLGKHQLYLWLGELLIANLILIIYNLFFTSFDV